MTPKPKHLIRRRILVLVSIIVFVTVVAFLVIKLAQGYRPDLNHLSFRPNGLLVATSDPNGAQLFIDGKLISATNTTLNLPPGTYEIEIKKDGYFPWKKTLPIKQELVTNTEAYLLPAFPNLQSLTFTGASRPVMSPDGQKVVFAAFSASAEKNGLWVLDLTDRPLGFNRDPRLIVKSAPKGRDFSEADYLWSPDSKEILVTLRNRPGPKSGQTVEENFLLDPNQLNLDTALVDITVSLPAISQRWQEDETLKKKAKFSKLPKELLKVLEENTKEIIFSPDETKLLYTATASASIPENIIPPLPAANSQPESRQLEPGKIYAYDLKEDKNFFITDEDKLPKPTPTETPNQKKTQKEGSELRTSASSALSWFPTSRHLFYVQKGKITILEYDNTNWVDVYTGPFENSFAFPFPTGNKILILASLGSDTPPNLYAISLH